MASSCRAFPFQVSCSIQGKPTIPNNKTYEQSFPKTTLSSTIKHEQPYLGALQQAVALPKSLLSASEEISESLKKAFAVFMDAFFDSVFEFNDLPLLPSQSNYAPVDELRSSVVVSTIQGKIPHSFPEGVYVRNGPNPLFGGLKSTKSVFGKSNHIWIEGEGMLHALYFRKDKDNNQSYNDWNIVYNNKYVETETFKLEKQRNKPSFLPTIGGDSSAILSAYLFNWLRFGKVNKYISNTNVFEHSGKLYSIAENHMPQEINISTLQTLGNWHLSSQWNRPFTSHPKRAPDTGELVIIGMDAIKPYVEIGVISADAKKLAHRVDLKLDRCAYCHDFGVTQRYVVVMDFPLTIDIARLVRGGPLIKYNKEGYARIGVMPRYGNADSLRWFKVAPNCTFHILNCFEDGDDEVVVWGCRALESVIDSSKIDINKDRNYDLLHHRPYEWRLNMRTGQVSQERNLTSDAEFSMDFPIINPNFSGLKNKFGYTQVVDPTSRTTSDMPKFGGLGKLHFEQQDTRFPLTRREDEKDMIKVEYHMFEKNTFCSGAAFVAKEGVCVEEDDGWIVTFVHNENTDISQVLVIDAKKFSDDPIAKITLPYRVPYGFHGAFIPMPPVILDTS